MCLQTTLIADISRMYNESRPFVGCAIPQFIGPVILIGGVEYLRVRHMQEAMAPVTGDTSFPFLQAEIIGFILTLRTQIVLVRPITGRGRDEYKALPGMSG